MRKTKMTRILALLLSSAMVLSSSAAVYADEDTGGSDLDYVELTFYANDGDARYGGDFSPIQEALDEYFLEKLNCKVNVVRYEEASYGSTVSNALLSGEEMDIVNIYNTGEYGVMADAGAFYPLKDLLAEYGQGAYASLAEQVWTGLTVNDDIYMVPSVKDNCYLIGYHFNKELAEEIGVTAEKLGLKSNISDNFDGVYETLKAAKEKRDELYPDWADQPIAYLTLDNILVPYEFAIENFINSALMSSVAGCNVPGMELDPSRGEHEVFNMFETQKFRDYLDFSQKMMSEGLVPYDKSTGIDYSTAPFIVMWQSWGWAWADDHAVSDEFTTDLHVYDNIYTDMTNFNTAGLAIGSACKNPERAMMVINEFYTSEYLATLVRFGVEGTHWQINENGEMELCGENADPLNPGWLSWYGGEFGNMLICRGPANLTGPNNVVIDMIKEYNDNCIYATHMGFVPDLSSITNEIAAVNNVINEYQYLFAGKVEAEEIQGLYDEFIQKMKDNGSDRILEVVQEQLDAWLAEK